MSRYEDRLREGEETQRRMLEAAGVTTLDPEKVKGVLSEALEALRKHATRLRDVDLEKDVKCPGCGETVTKPPSAKDLAQTMAYTGKVLDEVYRLSEFAQGRADSRPELNAGNLLEFLSDDQILTLTSWVEAGKAGRQDKMPKGGFIQ